MLHDLKVVTVFLTRLPVPVAGRVTLQDLAGAARAFPLVGMVVGGFGAGGYWLGYWLSLPSFACAIVAVASMVLVTGALHEDGLADTADALGTADRERALAIMRDSRIGTFGAMALILATSARLASIAGAGDPIRAAALVIGAAAFSRAVLPIVMLAQPSARSDGLAATAGRPTLRGAGASMALGIGGCFAVLPGDAALRCMIASAVASATAAVLLGRRFGGCTGDTLGATQQVAEVGFLMALATGP